MKAIAEYFRDLAADDRYFGAEPPTPDAEMLARIAEREIARRVEAHTGDDGIVLRPSLADASAVSTAAAQETPPVEEPVAEPEPDMPETTTAEEVEATDSIADRVAALSAIAQDDGAPEAASSDMSHNEEVIEEPDAAVSSEADALDDAAAFLTEEALSSDAAEPGVEAGAEQERAEASEDEDETSIAAKLRRIRNVVSNPAAQGIAETAAFEDSEFSEDEHAESDGGDVMDNVMATLGSGDAEDVVEDTPAAPSAMEMADVAEFDEDLSEAAEAQSDTSEAEAAETAPEPEREEQSEAEQVVAEETTASPIPESAQPRIAPRRPVRVVKVKRRSLHQAEDAPQADPVQPQAAESGDSSLSAEDEADLQRELQELEAELEGDTQPMAADAQDDVETAEEELTAPEGSLRAVRALANRDQLESLAEDDSDMSRLMAQTNEEMQEPEGRNRRNAIAHLRAAVAATRADRSGEKPASDPADPLNAYRADLAEAVRPRRTVSAQDEVETPRVAPLKLVAEQRVDVDTAEDQAAAQRAAAQAVRPRRVSLQDADDGVEGDAGGFAAFAEERGASRLPDLLEAAAAYMSFVEGREKFSRPQLMNKVRQIEELDSSREDRLRSFGQLLREGKIEKVEGGRFTASESIGFRPDARAAG
ncbi:hypothetical protein PGB28_01330 [Primorskyibacter aestuariivivens]|nr:hypothetical protein [Primorskyibacter aestuariivivens]MDA7427083.1 hypothetical protein [Primorskyibacter aestuariivivens]